VELTEELDPEKAVITLQVHDNIVARAKEDHVDETTKIIKQVMLAAPKDSIGWNFPFDTDMQVGQSWGELYEYDGTD
jgi:DNA polymerase I-like protein with 3'-5' exonuclease and polymerase domains